MSKLRLSFACGPYDRTQSLRDGSIQVEGVDLNYVNMQPAEIFWRQLQYQEFDASEMSLSNYTTLVSSGKSPFIAIPVYPSRVFRHGYFFVNTEQGHQERRRPQGQARRRAGIQHDRGGLHARADAARVRREAVRRRMGAGPPRPAWPQAARRHQADPGADRHRARRHAGARRDRFHDDGEQSAVVPPRLEERGAAVPELRRDGEGLLQADQDLSDHAHRGDQARDLRPRAVGGA